MLSKILTRGGPACGYLVIRYLKFMVLLAATPIALLLAWMIPGATAGLVRLANSELYRAGRYLGEDETVQLPPAAERAPGDLVTLFRDKSFKRSLWLYLGPLVMIPELFVAVASISAVPSA